MPSINLNPYDYISFTGDLRLKYGTPEVPYIAPLGVLGYNFGTTDHQLTIFDTVQRNGRHESLEIQFIPSGISGQRTANLKDINVVGRNNPFVQYTGGKEIITLPLEFYSDVSLHDDVKEKIDWLRSLTINDSENGYRRIKIIFGKLFRWEVFVVKSVSYKMSHFDGDSKFLPLRATCTLSLQIDTEEDVTIDDLRR